MVVGLFVDSAVGGLRLGWLRLRLGWLRLVLYVGSESDGLGCWLGCWLGGRVGGLNLLRLVLALGDGLG